MGSNIKNGIFDDEYYLLFQDDKMCLDEDFACKKCVTNYRSVVKKLRIKIHGNGNYGKENELKVELKPTEGADEIRGGFLADHTEQAVIKTQRPIFKSTVEKIDDKRSKTMQPMQQVVVKKPRVILKKSVTNTKADDEINKADDRKKMKIHCYGNNGKGKVEREKLKAAIQQLKPTEGAEVRGDFFGDYTEQAVVKKLVFEKSVLAAISKTDKKIDDDKKKSKTMQQVVVKKPRLILKKSVPNFKAADDDKVDEKKRKIMMQDWEPTSQVLSKKIKCCGDNYELRLEATKQRLRESYDQIQQAKQQRKIQVIEFQQKQQPKSKGKPSLRQKLMAMAKR